MTLAHVIEHGERQWEDICKEEFDKLSAGKWNYDFEILIDGRAKVHQMLSKI